LGKIKYWLGVIGVAGSVGILALIVSMFDLLDWVPTKTVTVVKMPPVQLDEQQFDKLSLIIKNGQDKAIIPTPKQPIKANTPIPKKHTAVISDMQSIMIDHANTYISVSFKKVLSKNFAKLTVAPIGKKPISLPIYNSGQYLEFNSNTGGHIATVLNVDFSNKKIEVGVSKVN